MRRIQINTTLEKKDLDFIRDNVDNMTKAEMSKRLKCSEGKIRENIRIAGIVFTNKNRFGAFKNKEKVSKSESGEFFNVNQYSDWLTGGSRYMDTK